MSRSQTVVFQHNINVWMEPWDSWDHELVSGHVLGDQWLRMATLIVCSKVALRATFLAVWRQTAAARVQIDDVLLHM